MFDVAIFDGKANIDTTEQPRRVRNIRPGMSRDLKVAIQTCAQRTRWHPVSTEHLQELVDLSLIEKRFDHQYLAALERVVALL